MELCLLGLMSVLDIGGKSWQFPFARVEVCHGFEHEISLSEERAIVQRMRDGDDSHARCFGCCHTVGRVLEHKHSVELVVLHALHHSPSIVRDAQQVIDHRPQAYQPARGLDKDIGSRLACLDRWIVSRHDRFEE